MTGPVGLQPTGHRRRRAGIRSRILAWYVVLLTIATGITIALERSALLSSLDQRIQAELEQEADEFDRLLGGTAPDGSCRTGERQDGGCEVGRNPATGEPFDDDMAAAFDTFLRRSIPGEHETMVTFVDGRFHGSSLDSPPVELQEVPAFVDEVASLRTPRQQELATTAGPVRYLAVPVGPPGTDAVFVVAQFLDPQLEQARENVRIAVIANLGVLGIASLLAYLATGRLMRPVRLVTETATAISETDLSRRIPVEGDDEISRLATTFNAMLDRLEEAFRTQRQLFDDAGHELRTPITIVRGNLELLPDDPAARDRSIAIVTDELDRMARMVQDLLTLAKSGRPDFLSTSELRLDHLLVDAHAKASALAAREWTTDTCGPVSLVADPQRLTQALVQLAGNATRHTDHGDRITLGCDVDGDDVLLWVADTGVGISAADQQRIFERFSRGAEPRGDGSGLGLSIVTAIAEAHGGDVTVESEPGQGARFTLRLPRRGPTVSPTREATP